MKPVSENWMFKVLSGPKLAHEMDFFVWQSLIAAGISRKEK